MLYEANCNSVGGILHEMAHAVGLTHEHNRTDRDDYIQVLFLNIPYGKINIMLFDLVSIGLTHQYLSIP